MIYCRRFFFLYSIGYDFIYIYETGLNLNFIPTYAYGEKNTLVRLDWTHSKSVNYSFLGEIGKEGLIGYRVLKGGTIGADFYFYLMQMIEVLGIDAEKTMFVFDSLPAHKIKAMYNVTRRKINILFLSKYIHM